jgi:hypothetical protein
LNHIRIFLFILFFHMLGCVSVNIDGGKPVKSSDVKYQEPKVPFKKISNPTVDMAWQNSKNGNTIAFLSECKLKADISLQTMETESLAALANLKVSKSDVKEFNEREAKEVLAEGQVDGIAVKMKLMLLKKNECNYTFSYVGRKKFFESDLNIYQQFLDGFQAP